MAVPEMKHHKGFQFDVGPSGTTARLLAELDPDPIRELAAQLREAKRVFEERTVDAYAAHEGREAVKARMRAAAQAARMSGVQR